MEDARRPLLRHRVDLDPDELDESTKYHKWRRETRAFVTSKAGHYFVITLVSLDVTGIFLDFLLKLYICDRTCGRAETVPDAIPEAVSALGVISLIFSCLFMAELMANIWAFGLQSVKTLLSEEHD